MVRETQCGFKQKSYVIRPGFRLDNRVGHTNRDNSRQEAGVGTGEEAISKVKVNLTQHIKINLTWSINLNVKSKALKFLEENIRDYLHDLWVGKDVLNTSQKALAIKKRLINWTSLK